MIALATASTAYARDMTTVFVFDMHAAEPVFHAYGYMTIGDDVTRCGHRIWHRGSRGAATSLPRAHAQRFARPCRHCFSSERST